MEIPKPIKSPDPRFCHESIYGGCRQVIFTGLGFNIGQKCYCPECYNKKWRGILNDRPEMRR